MFANSFWFYLPGVVQKKISRIFAYFFELKLSRIMILPYCLFFDISSEYLEQFEPDSGKSYYRSYSDFFQRRYKLSPSISHSIVWPCEGYVCDWGLFAEKENSIVKGQLLKLNDVFASDIKNEANYFFVNIFLHNHNYHRIHSPIDGRIKRISHIPGDLVFLRPWFYKISDVSYPAIRNERVIFEMTDSQDRSWYLAMVGGFGVGTIQVSHHVKEGTQLQVGEEMAKFKLGSTVCLATPEVFEVKNYLQPVHVGNASKET